MAYDILTLIQNIYKEKLWLRILLQQSEMVMCLKYLNFCKMGQKLMDDERGWSPLMHAVFSGNPNIVKMLLNMGADKDTRNKHGRSVLTQASRFGHAEVVKVLLDWGVNKEHRDRAGQSPLIYAARKGHIDVMAVLLKRGADINGPDKHGRTPLMHAVDLLQYDSVQFLVEHGANRLLKNKFGETAYDYAQKWGDKTLMRLVSVPQKVLAYNNLSFTHTQMQQNTL